MQIFRLEHQADGVGPFQHRSSRKILDHLLTSHDFMPELDEIPEVRRIMKENAKCVFGWSSQELFDKMILDIVAVHNLGFRLIVYHRPALYVSKCGQVIFLKKDRFING
jgi:hypothetical protein